MDTDQFTSWPFEALGKPCEVKVSRRSPVTGIPWGKHLVSTYLNMLEAGEETPPFLQKVFTIGVGKILELYTDLGFRTLCGFNSENARRYNTTHIHGIPIPQRDGTIPPEVAPLPTEIIKTPVAGPLTHTRGLFEISLHRIVHPFRGLQFHGDFVCNGLRPDADIEKVGEALIAITSWLNAQDSEEARFGDLKGAGYRLLFVLGPGTTFDTLQIHVLVPEAGRKLWPLVGGWKDEALRPIEQ